MRIFGSFDGTGCGVYRVQLPLTALKVKGGHEVHIREMSLPPAPDNGKRFFDIMCMNRQRLIADKGQIPVAEWFKRQQDLGTLMVADCDDDIWHLDRTNPSWMNLTEEQVKGEEQVLRLADLVTTTTKPLAKILSKFNENVVVIPNYVPGQLLTAKRTYNVESPKLIVGWTGSLSHMADLRSIDGVLQRYSYEFPDVDLHAVGLNFGQLLGMPNVRHTDWDMNIWQYYVNLDFDIGLAPLRHTKFNRSKSGIKAIEHMALGIPIIATDIEPYRDIVQHGVTGFLCKEKRHWLTALRRLTTDEELRRKMSHAAKEAAKDYIIENNWQKWENAYQAAFERRQKILRDREAQWASVSA